MARKTTPTVAVEFPEIFFTDKGMNPQYIKEAVAAVSYYNGILSEKEACDMTQTTRRHFEEVILPKFRLSVMGGTPEDVTIEIQSL